METLGDLVDKLSISCIRLEKLSEKGYDKDSEQHISTKENCDILRQEIDQYLEKYLSGKIHVQPNKNKIYENEDASKVESSSLGTAVNQLFVANYTLWQLEDLRRDKSQEDQKRLEACDSVSVWNRVRNDWIDMINKILADRVNGLHKSKNSNEPNNP